MRWHNIAMRWHNIAMRWHNIALLRACTVCLQHGQRTFGLVELDILEGRTFRAPSYYPSLLSDGGGLG